jgi:hypothetical protein
MRSATDQLLNFYVLDDGSGDILIATATYQDGTAWHMRFEHFPGGQMPADMRTLLGFIMG